ncbi:uncharacterized protein LOC141850328 [Brevipalpus obovatus]|uniref:uncharacterized protein LOC141850328 n=1 Tax=Brevipalpus obovatus TaxID=246614 RepID=UPI003D9E8A2B
MMTEMKTLLFISFFMCIFVRMMVLSTDEIEISVEHQEPATVGTLLKAPCESSKTGISSVNQQISGTDKCKPSRAMESIRRRLSQFSNAARNFYENANGASAALILNPRAAIRNVVSALRPKNKPYRTTQRPSI